MSPPGVICLLSALQFSRSDNAVAASGLDCSAASRQTRRIWIIPPYEWVRLSGDALTQGVENAFRGKG